VPVPAQLLLDGVDDGFDLTLVVAGDDEEDVGDREALADVDDHDVGGELVGRRLGSELRGLDGFVRCGHDRPVYGCLTSGTAGAC